jgi:hypothetical protein
MNKSTLALASLAFSLSCATLDASAQESGLQNYEVEVIVFRVNRPSSSPEHWAIEGVINKSATVTGEEDSTSTPVAPAAPPSAPAAPPVAETNFQALSMAQFRMNAIEDALRRSRNYQPLAHIGWVQPGFPLGSTPKFSLQSYLPAFLPEGVALTGAASLGRGARLLHLTLDLTYQAPDGQKYVLKETRRMRSTEKHYLDHPYFGAIALITPKN